MRISTTRMVAWSIGIASIMLAISALVLIFIDRHAVLPAGAGRWTLSNLLGYIVDITIPVIGIVLASRRPQNPIGWLFVAAGFLLAFSGFGLSYGLHALVADPGSLPAGRALVWGSSWLPGPGALAMLAFLFLLFPTGHLPSARWRPVAWFVGGAFTLLAVRLLVRSIEIWSNPLGPNPNAGLPLLQVVPIVVAALAASVTATVVRFVRSVGEERLQLKWFTTAAALVVVTTVPTLVSNSATVSVLNSVSFLFLWAAIAIAVLKYRLYEIDVVISKTVVYGTLAAFITLVYVGLVIGVGTLVGNRQSALLSAIAAAVVAVAFQPVRQWAGRLANRVVYGKRATPYEVLSEISHGMAGTLSTEDTLSRIPRLVVEATGATQATVWLQLGETLEPGSSWPPTAPSPEPIRSLGHGIAEALHIKHPKAQAFLVEHQDELLGALTVQFSASEPLTPAGEKLIRDLATQTGMGLDFDRMKERALFSRALASFLPPEVAELVEASPSALALREEVEATILFSDIRGFSTMAERLPPGEVADVVGRHLTAMAEVVASNGGTLDKFAGDAVMAVFGAPRRIDDHAARALRCAIAMQHRQAALNAEADSLGWPTSAIGIGVNTGTVIAGTVGGPGRLDYTVLGDAVNVAQRLQSEAAGGEILASAATVIDADLAGAEPAGFKRLKGRQQPVEAHRVPWETIDRAG